MESIYIRTMKYEDIEETAKQIQISYCTSYLQLMDRTYLQSLEYTYWVPILHKCMDQDDVCLVAMHNNQIIGSAIAGRSDEAKIAMLHAIYILPEYQNHQIGDRLYTCMEDMLLAQGFSTCQLEVLSQNHRAIKFYSEHGFTCVHTFEVEEEDMLLQCDLMEKTFFKKE